MNIRSARLLWALLVLSLVAARGNAQVPALPRCDSILQQQPANICNAQAASASDARLHLLLAELEKTVRSSQLQKLHESQTHWARYRDEQCALEYSVAQGGTLAPSLGAKCAVRLTEARIAELKLFLCPGEGLEASCAAARRYDLPARRR
jgi:uncharacterized protein YecT (DUF1311 family)